MKKSVLLFFIFLISSCNFIAETDLSALPDKKSNKFECPSGFIIVYGNPSLGTDNFCVMKYEARDISGDPFSVPTGSAWVNISAANAWNMCNNLNGLYPTQGGLFAIISNPEWMTIARDAEMISSNWSGGSIGVGFIARGWARSDNTQAAPNALDSCLYNSSSNNCTATGDHVERRTLQLSSGEEIWDFNANVHNWVDWDAGIPSFTQGPTGCLEDTGWVTFDNASLTFPCGSAPALLEDDLLPVDSALPSDNGIGRFYGGLASSDSAAQRGGTYNLDLKGASRLIPKTHQKEVVF